MKKAQLNISNLEQTDIKIGPFLAGEYGDLFPS